MTRETTCAPDDSTDHCKWMELGRPHYHVSDHGNDPNGCTGHPLIKHTWRRRAQISTTMHLRCKMRNRGPYHLPALFFWLAQSWSHTAAQRQRWPQFRKPVESSWLNSTRRQKFPTWKLRRVLCFGHLMDFLFVIPVDFQHEQMILGPAGQNCAARYTYLFQIHVRCCHRSTSTMHQI